MEAKGARGSLASAGDDPVLAAGRTVRNGQLVRSIQGRDRGRWYLVVDRDKDGFLYVADGVYRSVTRPKKKNPKHLLLWQAVAADVAAALDQGQKITDAEVQEGLQEIIPMEEQDVNGEEVDDTGEAGRN